MPSDQILIVGDTPTNDYEGAISVGWHAILLDRGRRDGAADWIGSLSQLAERLHER